VSHALGTGGRDLKAEVGAITTLMAIDALEADTATKHVVLVSKPPAPQVARLVLDRIARSAKPFTVCFIGAAELALPGNARAAATLKAAAELALGRSLAGNPARPFARLRRGSFVRGLFAGGTLCSEAQVVFSNSGVPVASNVPVPGATALTGAPAGHVMIDLGDDQFTRGRPHPMIEPAVRDAPLAAALADANVGVVLLDVVLGYGAHADPAGHLAQALRGRRDGPAIVASVTGTDADPQPRCEQVRKLEAAGVVVAESNADAAALAVADARAKTGAAAQ
jgi:succinyl-CoA synthetase alpha subunit